MNKLVPVSCLDEGVGSSYLQFHDVNISLELKDWIFALEGAELMAERGRFDDLEDSYIKERSWHTFFESFVVKANGSKNEKVGRKYPVEVVKVCIFFSTSPLLFNGNPNLDL